MPVAGISRAETSNYIPQYLWDVITCPCPRYPLLAQLSWFPDTETAQAVENIPWGTQRSFTLHSQYHGCWWPGDARSQGISSYIIDLNLLKYSSICIVCVDVCGVLHHNQVWHCCDVIMGTMASQITSLTIVYSAVYSGADQREHQSSASLAFVWEINRGPVNSQHKWPIKWEMFPFDDVIMKCRDKYLHPTVFLGCNYLSLPLIPESGTALLKWNLAITMMLSAIFPSMFLSLLTISNMFHLRRRHGENTQTLFREALRELSRCVFTLSTTHRLGHNVGMC